MPLNTSKESLKVTTPSVCFLTLGCKVNQTESEELAQLFHNDGYNVVDSSDEADVVVVNTCTVTNTGDAKSRQGIRRMIKAHPDAFVVVMGCYAQTAPGEVLNIEGVDLVLGTQDRGKILELIEQVRKEQKPQSNVHTIWDAVKFEELPLMEGESRTRATLKIQEGCNKFCTYCIIPYARGPVRSRIPENAVAEAKKLVAAGYKEIVLTGIHTGSYGEDLGEDWNLARLVKELANIPGLYRLRLSSIEPMEFTPELIEVILSSPAVCTHLHIPLQSGSDAILVRMKRPYTLREFKKLIDELNQRLPGIAITTDVIVGFPGETEQDFQDSLEFVRSCHFAGAHVFPYSKREGTPAAKYPDQIIKKVKEQRVKDLMEVARQSHEDYVEKCIGQKEEVLIERVNEDGTATGHTRNYIQVKLPARKDGRAWENGELVEFIFEAKHIWK
ncbi:tRNA (N(6)-L-threonylcarbamoyladenosine(37)-C(2))-methylthiotransferase MtaB [Desulfitobacterium sp.]|uniref:tRNA (N(6)-L-threonylcarbamoyladenosine(37)-C(2))- methylthiotransferase MtaB n=1 Tax=Desulfitobacterium sp. TaxID=49981 RepID=UPI002B648704|nr:tRNA (N(6)-L-threonylcarbamoyladenosine(37)-C(2))-methylthiotransferase MtaB [Desulfitobacterium sp.]HVJ50184.1 tRNA (N(6)-L-threonylcarbamoyladenosine(37)-C(2))-methylthiotransferase MtaB [Desulfitobacterium sp.]